MNLSRLALVFYAAVLIVVAGCGRPSQSTVAAEKDELKAYLAEHGDDSDTNADDGNQ